VPSSVPMPRLENPQLRGCVLKRALAVCSIAWVMAWSAFARAADSKKLTVRLLDGQPIAARVSVVGSDGKPYASPGSILRQPEGATPYFYADGKFVVTLPPGVARLEFWRGVEYLPARVDVDLQSDAEIAVRLVRWVHLAEEGWYSGDSHIHLHTGGPIKVDVADALLAARAEDLNYSNLCVSNNVGDDVRDAELITGKPHALSDERHLLVFGEEMRSSIYGHMQFFGIKKLVEPQYTGFDKTPISNDYPPNFQQAEEAVRQGGVVTYGHPIFTNQPDPFTVDPLVHNAAARELPIDAVLGKVHAMDLMCYGSDEDLSAQLWYRLLNTGLRLAASVGTDALLDHPTLPLGGERVYVKVDGKFTMENWLNGLKAGRSFVTNGPMLSLRVNGQGIGETVRLDAPGKVRVEAEVQSAVPLSTLELIASGNIVRSEPCPAKQGEGGIVIKQLVADISMEQSGWVALRARGQASRHVFDGPAWAHASPVFVTVAGKPIASKKDAAFFVEWIDRLIDSMGRRNRYAKPEDRQGVEALFRRAQTRFREIATAER
jgi:TolB protein